MGLVLGGGTTRRGPRKTDAAIFSLTTCGPGSRLTNTLLPVDWLRSCRKPWTGRFVCWTPPKQPVVLPPGRRPPVVPPPSPGKWKIIGTESKTRLAEMEAAATVEELLRKLKANQHYRLSIQWTLEEGPQ